MKKIVKEFNIYKFNELKEECEDLQTPWFIGHYIYDYCKKDILKKAKKYMYYENGNIYFE